MREVKKYDKLWENHINILEMKMCIRDRSITDRENFWERLNKDLKRIGFDIKIVVYFRRQNLFVQSHWAQKIKEGEEYNFHEYLESPIFTEYPLDYYEYMHMLSLIHI